MTIIKILKIVCFFAIGVIQLLAGETSFALSVIPGAKGFGMETPAGRGGQIMRVTNLNASGSGSLREAIEASGPRIVIFEVSGTIVYYGRYKIKNPFITIAGQTAPSPGVTLRGSVMTVDTHDVLIQHLRFRPGDDIEGVEPENRDSINIGLIQPPEGLYNIVIDHCSASWSIDETIEILGCSNVTFRNCIISEPLSYSLHPKGEHSKAMIVGQFANSVSIIENLFAHSVDRNPFVAYGNNSVVIANNLIYNPKSINKIIQVRRGPAILSIVGNVVKAGPNSSSIAANKSPYFKNDPYVNSQIFLSDNRTDIERSNDQEDWSLIANYTDSYSIEQIIEKFKVDNPPVWPKNYETMPSSVVEKTLIQNTGARPADRDSVDSRIISDVIHRSGKIINSPDDVGGFPKLQENRVTHTLPSNPNEDDDGDGYTNIEEWLHDMARAVESSVSAPEQLEIQSFSD